jgi:hypothetical protein
MKTKPYIQDSDMPGPGTYDVRTFVEQIKNDPKNFTIGRKEDYCYRKYLNYYN